MKTKENRGVTLIALAVKIIIMLILAGVTISTLTGNSGISSNANQARIQNELARYKEQMELYLAEKKGRSLLKIEIPKTVKSIGDSCFSDNTSSLEEILIKNKENSITGAPWGAAKGMKVVQWKK